MSKNMSFVENCFAGRRCERNFCHGFDRGIFSDKEHDSLARIRRIPHVHNDMPSIRKAVQPHLPVLFVDNGFVTFDIGEARKKLYGRSQKNRVPPHLRTELERSPAFQNRQRLCRIAENDPTWLCTLRNRADFRGASAWSLPTAQLPAEMQCSRVFDVVRMSAGVSQSSSNRSRLVVHGADGSGPIKYQARRRAVREVIDDRFFNVVQDIREWL